jgi:hypothetical protein
MAINNDVDVPVENYYSNAEVVQNGPVTVFRIKTFGIRGGVFYGLHIATDEAGGRYAVGDKVRVAGLTLRFTDGKQLEVTGIWQSPVEVEEPTQ